MVDVDEVDWLADWNIPAKWCDLDEEMLLRLLADDFSEVSLLCEGVLVGDIESGFATEPTARCEAGRRRSVAGLRYSSRVVGVAG